MTSHRPADSRLEQLHLGEASGATWQENLYFMGWNPQTRSGFLAHTKLIPERNEAHVRASVIIQGREFTCGVRLALRARLDYPGWVARNDEPFRKWTLSFSGVGFPVTETGGYHGLYLDRPGHVPLSFEVELTAQSAPIDWSVVTGDSGAGGSHYDHCHTWSGILRAGDAQVQDAGLGIRDHSWGARDLSGLEWAWFAAVVYPGATRQLTCLRACRAGQEFGYGFSADTERFEVLPAPDIGVLDGTRSSGDFRLVQVRCGGHEYEARTDMTTVLPLLADGYLSSDAIGSVQLPEGVGLSFVELGEGLSSGAVARILEGVPGAVS